MRRSRAQGFTLVEIMIVVAIIALLAAIAIPNVLRGRTTANESAAIGNVRALISSLEMVRSVNQAYPALETWYATMYGTDCLLSAPNPDFGPPSFCMATLNGGTDVVQGFIYDYTGLAAPSGTYTLSVWAQTMGTTGTRAFFANETGLVRHCTMTASTSRAVVTSATIDVQPVDCI